MESFFEVGVASAYSLRRTAPASNGIQGVGDLGTADRRDQVAAPNPLKHL
jgi:hypothetical protein